jgi:outer membrane protein assembly factor BamB
MTYRQDAGPPPAEIDRSLLVVGLNGIVVALERATGQLRWRNDLPGHGGREVFLALRYGVLVVSASGNGVARLDYATGALVWEHPTRGSGRATILVEPELIVVAKGGYLDAFDHDGRLLWQQPLEGVGMGGTSLGFPGNVVQADGQGS